MFVCPTCKVKLEKSNESAGVYWSCLKCQGRSSTISVLRKLVPKKIVNSLWLSANQAKYPRIRSCACCQQPMTEVPIKSANSSVHLDVCRSCQCVWFDAQEYQSLPSTTTKAKPGHPLPADLHEQLALKKVETVRLKRNKPFFVHDSPQASWQWIPGFFGLPVEYQPNKLTQTPWVTWLITAMILLTGFFAFSDLQYQVSNYGLIPAEMDRRYGSTFISSFFLHGSILHLIINLYFFLIFGDNVEDYLGKSGFILLLVSSTLMGDIFHILAQADSNIPMIGASGGISGIITFYALKFPKTKLSYFRGFLNRFRWIKMSAWLMFAIWVTIQMLGVWLQMSGASNVSALAHVGGIMAGFGFWYFEHKANNGDQSN